MKCKLFAIFGLALFLLSSCQKNNDEEIVSQSFVHKYGFEISEKEWEARNKNGEVVLTLKNGITETSTYKNGILNGSQTITFPHSKVIQERLEYDEGNLIKKTIYDIGGLPVQEYSYECDGKRIITRWDKNGVPLSMEEYENDLLWSARYYNSQNEIEGTVIDGKGTRFKRNRDGLLLSKEIVDNGIITNRKTFHPNGQLQSQTSFLDYQLHGKQQTYSLEGKLETSINWDHGKIKGTVTCYKNNKLVNEIPYINGQKHGVEKEYDISGALVKEVHWDNGQKHGTERSYLEDFTDVQWYWKGVSVDLKKYQELKFREELMADLHDSSIFDNFIKR